MICVLVLGILRENYNANILNHLSIRIISAVTLFSGGSRVRILQPIFDEAEALNLKESLYSTPVSSVKKLINSKTIAKILFYSIKKLVFENVGFK